MNGAGNKEKYTRGVDVNKRRLALQTALIFSRQFFYRAIMHKNRE
jgi:hypothetical protein